MTTAARVLDVARQELGTREAPDGSNPYGRAYGVDRVAWCMQFVWWCFRQAGASALIHPKTAYTPTAYDWHRVRGQTSSTPRVGSLVFYDWPPANRIQHVGIVEDVEPAAIVTIEGNTSTSDQSDGGGVMRRRRARNGSIVGYGHPAYGRPSPTSGRRRPPDHEEDDMTPAQAQMLAEIHGQMFGPWPTWDGGTSEKLTLVDYARRGNVETRALHRNLNEGVHRKLDTLLAQHAAAAGDAALTAAEAGGAVLTVDQVRQILRDALADLGPLHLTTEQPG